MHSYMHTDVPASQHICFTHPTSYVEDNPSAIKVGHHVQQR